MSEARLENQQPVTRWVFISRLALAIFTLLVLFMGLAPDWFFALIPLTIVVAYIGGMWWSIRLLWRSQAGEPELSRVVGWKIFWPIGIFCSLCMVLLFYAPGGSGSGGDWIGAIIFGLPYLVACLGFLQGMSSQPFIKLPRNWDKLELWRRFSLVTFIGGAAWLFILCIYYAACLSEGVVVDNS